RVGQADRGDAGPDRRRLEELRGRVARQAPLRSAAEIKRAGLMLTERDIVARVQHVTVTRLRVWVRAGWIRPAAKAEHGFSEADMARAALIRDLEDKLGFDEDQVPVLLNLIDQIHGLRAKL